MNKKIILLSTLILISVVALGQSVHAASSILSVSPATASKTVGTTFNVSVKVDPQGNKVCVVKGTLSFTNLTCQSITLASGIMAAVSPTCASPSFTLGIPTCTTAVQNMLTVSVKGNNAGQANASVAGAKVIGAGTAVVFTANGGTYNITAVPVPTPTPTTTPTTTPTPTSCTPNWQMSEWSACTDSQQTRTVTDLNNCGITTDEPETIQSCVEQTNPVNSIPASVGAAGFLSIASDYFWPILIILIILVVGYGIYYLAKKRKK